MLTKCIRGLDKRGADRYKGALCTVAAGGQWTRARIADHGGTLDSDLCPRCGREAETDLHRAWTCPCNGDLKECEATNHLIDKAAEQAGRTPCYWLRGLLPKAWVAVDEPPDACEPCISEQAVQEARPRHRVGNDLVDGGALGRIFAERRLWFAGDGSGRPYGKHKASCGPHGE